MRGSRQTGGGGGAAGGRHSAGTRTPGTRTPGTRTPGTRTPGTFTEYRERSMSRPAGQPRQAPHPLSADFEHGSCRPSEAAGMGQQLHELTLSTGAPAAPGWVETDRLPSSPCRGALAEALGLSYLGEPGRDSRDYTGTNISSSARPGGGGVGGSRWGDAYTCCALGPLLECVGI